GPGVHPPRTDGRGNLRGPGRSAPGLGVAAVPRRGPAAGRRGRPPRRTGTAGPACRAAQRGRLGVRRGDYESAARILVDARRVWFTAGLVPELLAALKEIP